MTFFIPRAALDQHIAILGKTGSGKTWTAKLIVEHVLRQHRQTCILDPTGAWYGLRLAADGRSKGFDIILLGGEHADIPLAERSGAAIARLVTEQGASVVIDTSGLTVGEYTRWFIDFAGTLYTTLRRPLHLVIDECHYFMPQGRVPDPDAGRMLHAGNRLMSGGRSRGIRGIMITQRPAKLHKDSLTCADTLIAMRVIAPQDRQAVKDWIDGCGNAEDGKSVLDSLAQLKRGEGWVWYPEGAHLQRVTFPSITTYDSSAAPKYGATSGPKVGQIDLSEVRTALAEAVREAEANDPKLLRKKIADLEKQLRAKKPEISMAPPRIEIERVEVPVLKNGQLDKAHSLVGKLETIAGDLKAAMARTASSAKMAPAPKLRPAPVQKPEKPPMRRRPPQAFESEQNGPLPIGERKILAALIQYPSGLRREQLTVLTGYKRSSRDAYLYRLREKGFVEEPAKDRFEATAEGQAALPDAEPLPRGEALRDYHMERLPMGERAVLQFLMDRYPNTVTREEIDEATNYKRSSRDAYLHRLSNRQLIELTRNGVSASEELFQ